MGILHSKFRSQSTSSSPTRFRNPFVFHTFRDMSCFAVLVFLLVSPRGLGHFVRSTRIDFIVHDIFNSDSWKRLEARFNDTAGTGLGLGDMQAAVTFTLLATTMIFIPLRILRALYAFIFIPVLRRLSFGLARFFSRRSSTRADIYTALKSSEDAKEIHDHSDAPFDELLSTSYEIYLLQESLTAAHANSQSHQLHAKRLEYLLSQEQHKSTLATRELRKLLRPRSFSITGITPNDGSVVRKLSWEQVMGTGVLLLGLLYRLTTVLGRKLAAKTLSVMHLREVLNALKSKYEGLLLDAAVLKSQNQTLTSQLSASTNAQTALSQKLMALHVKHSQSLRARQETAQGMIVVKKIMETEFKAETGRLMGIITGLWRDTTRTGEQIKEIRAKLIESNGELNAERTKRERVEGGLRVAFGRNAALSGELMREQGTVKEIQEQLRRQAAELAELRAAKEVFVVAHEEATSELEKTKQELQLARAEARKLDAQNESLLSSKTALESDFSDIRSRNTALQSELDDTVRNLGVVLAVFSQGMREERARVEEEKVRDMEPVRKFMNDIRTRVAKADEYILELSSPCGTPARVGQQTGDGFRNVGWLPTPQTPSMASLKRNPKVDTLRPLGRDYITNNILQGNTSYTMLSKMIDEQESPATSRALFHPTS